MSHTPTPILARELRLGEEVCTPGGIGSVECLHLCVDIPNAMHVYVRLNSEEVFIMHLDINCPLNRAVKDPVVVHPLLVRLLGRKNDSKQRKAN
jgi:hypothetical protein